MITSNKDVEDRVTALQHRVLMGDGDPEAWYLEEVAIYKDVLAALAKGLPVVSPHWAAAVALTAGLIPFDRHSA